MYDNSFKIRYAGAPVAISETCIGGGGADISISNAPILKHKTNTPPHMHGEVEMIMIERGSAEVDVCVDKFHVEEGDLIFVNPLEVHSISIKSTDDYMHKCVCFDASLIADDEIRDGISGGYMKIQTEVKGQSECSAELRRIIFTLFNAVLRGERTLLLECTAGISAILVYLIKNSMINKKVTGGKNERFLRFTVKYIEENYKNDISSKDAAEALGYTQSYFCRAFHKDFGVKFSEYLNMYRISVARELLEDSKLKIINVALQCGFSSSVNFSRVFKKHIGLLPSDYQKCQYRS